MNTSVIQGVNLAPLSFDELETIGGGMTAGDMVVTVILGIAVDYFCNTAARNASFMTGFNAGWNAAHP